MNQDVARSTASVTRCCLPLLLTLIFDASMPEASLADRAQARTQASLNIPGLHVPLVSSFGTTLDEDQAIHTAAKDFRLQGPHTEDPLAPFEKYLSLYPASGWSVALHANLGTAYYRLGRFSLALAHFEKAWHLGRDAGEPMAKAIVDGAVSELARMHARLGHREELERLFVEIGDRTIIGSATEALVGAREGVWEMKNNPERAFLCGPKALSNTLRVLNASAKSVAHAESARSAPGGYSLRQLSQLADEANLPHYLIYRRVGQSIPVPSIANWSLHHYASITAEDGGRYIVKDPTFGEDLALTRTAIDAESSGYFLVPTGIPWDSSWRIVPAAEADSVFGMGWTMSNADGAVKPDDEKIRPDTCDRGMCRPNVHAMNVSLNLTDTPVGYAPQKGPPVFVRLTYNSRESAQPQAMSYFNVGPKWTLNMLSFVEDNPSSPGANVSRYVDGGGRVSYSNYTVSTGAFNPELQGSEILVRTPTTGIATSYTLTAPDGSKRVFSRSDGSTSIQRRMFLTAVVDRFGNSLAFSYDSQLRLTSIVDAAGRTTNFGYTHPSNPLLVTAITDPFGRSAVLDYDGLSRLQAITDVIGIKSSWDYLNDWHLYHLTTPYTKPPYTPGNVYWTFQTGSSNSDPNHPSGRYVHVVDPQGNTEYVEFRHQASGIDGFDLAPTVPTGFSLHNQWLEWRNTFYWDTHSYPLHGSPGIRNYKMAKRWHWLHNAAEQTSPLVESTKEPLEGGRVWYNYENQNRSTWPYMFEGSSGRVTGMGRALDLGGVEISRATYNALGNPLTRTDPAGRITRYTYTGNEQDVSLVERGSLYQGGYDVLDAFPQYNSQHQPLLKTDASGKLWAYSYNSYGQLATITDPLNHVVSYIYDSLGRLTELRNENNVAVVTLGYLQNCETVNPAHINCDLPVSVTDANGRTTQYERDALDRVTKRVFPDSTTEVTGYTNLDRTSFTDRLGRTTFYVYDSLQRLKSESDPENPGSVKVAYEYYANGSLRSITDASNNVTTWSIDIQGRPTQKMFPNGSFISYSYWPISGRLQSITDALGQVRTFNYTPDAGIGSVTYTNEVNPTPDVLYQYDVKYPRLAQMNDGTGTTIVNYRAPLTNGAGKLGLEYHDDQQDGSAGVNVDPYLDLDYDELGRIKSRQVSGESAEERWDYDSLGRVARHETSLGVFDYAYLGQTSKPISRTLAGTGIATTWNYDTAQNDRRLVSITNTSGGPDLALGYKATNHLGFEVYGRVTSVQQSDGSSPAKLMCQMYDEAGELEWSGVALGGASCSSQASWSKEYSFEQVSENLTEFSGRSTTANPTYNSANQILTSGARVFSHDAAGRLTGDGSRTFKWDAEDRLIEVSVGATVLSSYRYDGLNRLFEVSYPGRATQRFLWCGRKICARYSDAMFPKEDVLRARYFEEGEYHPFGKQSVSVRSGNGVSIRAPRGRRLVTSKNHLGNVIGLVDVDRRMYVGDTDYTPYGEITSAGVTADSPYGELFHDRVTGLYFSRSRVYDPSIGRWLTRDPIGEEGGINLYAYAANDPINQKDPSGENPALLCLTPVGAPACMAAGAALADAVVSAALLTAGVAAICVVWSKGQADEGEDDAADTAERERRALEDKCHNQCKHWLGENPQPGRRGRRTNRGRVGGGTNTQFKYDACRKECLADG